jgi:hypothetical protein
MFLSNFNQILYFPERPSYKFSNIKFLENSYGGRRADTYK